MRANVIVFNATVLILFPILYYGAQKVLGKARNRTFFVGSMLFGLAILTGSVLLGANNFFWYATNDYYTHYPLGGYIVWLGLVPLSALLLWYMVTVTSCIAASHLLSSERAWKNSALAAVLAVLFYLLIEPVAVTNHWWAWNLKSFYVIDVPLVCWAGVLASVFLFSLAYSVTMEKPTEFRFLKSLEAKTVKRWPVRSQKTAKNLRYGQLQWVFAFRLIVAFVAFSAAIAPFVLVFWLVANRGHVPPAW